ncbi:hypothetical protein MRY87_06130 [bacterium]|nr:hypothetical protein [bacterium]
MTRRKGNERRRQIVFRICRQITVCILLLLLLGCQEQILHDLSETEGNRLITKLHDIGIVAEKKIQADGTWALAVQKDDVLKALSALSDARVFRRAGGDYRERGDSMLPSRDAQRFQFERAVAQEIELTLSALGGVLESRVHLHLPPSDPLFGRKLADNFSTSASVLLITEESFVEDVEQIKELVSAAAGVNREKVSILVSGSRVEALRKGSASEKPQLLAATVRRNHISEEQIEESETPVGEVEQPHHQSEEEGEAARASFAVESELLKESKLSPELSLESKGRVSPIRGNDGDAEASVSSSSHLWWGILAFVLLLLGAGACLVARRVPLRFPTRKIGESSSFEKHLQNITLNGEHRR